jgi:hypothetical protein
MKLLLIKEASSIKCCQDELEVDDNTAIDWNNYMRVVCASWILQHQGMIGGLEKTVEVDESMFTRRKNDKDKMFPQQWVFGGFILFFLKYFLIKL